MTEKLLLRAPSMAELDIRAGWMQDPATMSYNRGYAPFDGYDPETGCIDFPEEAWADWYETWVRGEPEHYYAYIERARDHRVLGEVCLHKTGEAWEMGVLLMADYRGRGYAKEALRLLLEEAFDRLDLPEVVNRFELSREAAVRVHLAAGFFLIPAEDGLFEFRMPKARYYQMKDHTCAMRGEE